MFRGKQILEGSGNAAIPANDTTEHDIPTPRRRYYGCGMRNKPITLLLLVFSGACGDFPKQELLQRRG